MVKQTQLCAPAVVVFPGRCTKGQSFCFARLDPCSSSSIPGNSPWCVGGNKAVRAGCRIALEPCWATFSTWWHTKVLAVALTFLWALFAYWPGFRNLSGNGHIFSMWILDFHLSFRLNSPTDFSRRTSLPKFLLETHLLSANSARISQSFSAVSSLRLEPLFPMRNVGIQENVATFFLSAHPIIWILAAICSGSSFASAGIPSQLGCYTWRYWTLLFAGCSDRDLGGSEEQAALLKPVVWKVDPPALRSAGKVSKCVLYL